LEYKDNYTSETAAFCLQLHPAIVGRRCWHEIKINWEFRAHSNAIVSSSSLKSEVSSSTESLTDGQRTLRKKR